MFLRSDVQEFIRRLDGEGVLLEFYDNLLSSTLGNQRDSTNAKHFVTTAFDWGDTHHWDRWYSIHRIWAEHVERRQ